LGSARTTATSSCIADQEMKIAHNGPTYFLVGPEEIDGIHFKRFAEEKGINFLPKGKNFMPVMIYRHVLPKVDFVGRFNDQYSWPPELINMTKEDVAGLFAQHRLIGDYAPTGQQMTAREIWNWLNQH
jgi:hypothetical protein